MPRAATHTRANEHLADMTGLPINKVQEALPHWKATGPSCGVTIVWRDGRKQRVIYPANALIPTPAVGVGHTPTVGVGGHPQQVGAHNLIKNARLPKSELARAPTRGQASGGTGGLGTWHGRGLSEQRSDQRWRGHTPDRGGHGRHVSGGGGGGRRRRVSSTDDLRRKAKGAAGDRPRDAGGMASDRTIAEDEGEWTL